MNGAGLGNSFQLFVGYFLIAVVCTIAAVRFAKPGWRSLKGARLDLFRNSSLAPFDFLPAEVSARRSGDNLVLAIAGTIDQITVSNYFANNEATPCSMERIQFLADGTAWDVLAVKAMVLQGTAGNDTLIGGGAANDAPFDATAIEILLRKAA